MQINQSNIFAAPHKGQCPNISGPHYSGRVSDSEINEASGLVASQSNPDIFWTFNDSGGRPCVYAVCKHGTLKYKLCLQGAWNRDWEAIGTGPCNKG